MKILFFALSLILAVNSTAFAQAKDEHVDYYEILKVYDNARSMKAEEFAGEWKFVMWTGSDSCVSNPAKYNRKNMDGIKNADGTEPGHLIFSFKKSTHAPNSQMTVVITNIAPGKNEGPLAVQSASPQFTVWAPYKGEIMVNKLSMTFSCRLDLQSNDLMYCMVQAGINQVYQQPNILRCMEPGEGSIQALKRIR